MGLAQRFVRGSVLNLANHALKLGAVFVLTPILVSQLGEQRYGLWLLLMAIFGQFGLLDVGLPLSVSRFLARALGQGDRGRLETVASSAFVLFGWSALAALAGSAVLWFAVPWFGGEAASVPTARGIIAIFAVFLASGFLSQVFSAYLKASLRYDLLVGASALRTVLAAVLTYTFVTRGAGLVELAFIHVGCGLLEQALVVAGALFVERGLRVRLRSASRACQGEVLKFSLVTFAIQFGRRLRTALDPLILAWVVGTAAVTHYSIGAQFANHFTDLFVAVFGGQLLAVLSRFAGAGQDGELRSTFLSSTRVGAVLAVAGATAMFLYADPFLQRWMGEGFDDSYRVLVILLPPTVLMVSQSASLNLFYALGRQKALAWITVLGGLGNAVLSIVLGLQVGFFGVVWATFIEMMIVFGIVLPVWGARAAGVPVRRFLLHGLGLPLAVSLACAVPFVWWAQGTAPEYLDLAFRSGLQVPAHLALCFWLVLTREERRHAFAMFGFLLPGAKA